MFKESLEIKYSKLLLKNPEGMIDKKAIEILKIDLNKFKDIIYFLEAKGLIIRFENEKKFFY